MESPKIYIDRQAECPILEQIRNELLRYDQNSNSLTFRYLFINLFIIII
jgi:hypothetical protein